MSLILSGQFTVGNGQADVANPRTTVYSVAIPCRQDDTNDLEAELRHFSLPPAISPDNTIALIYAKANAPPNQLFLEPLVFEPFTGDPDMEDYGSFLSTREGCFGFCVGWVRGAAVQIPGLPATFRAYNIETREYVNGANRDFNV
jgi:hypothetical protein